MNKLLVLMMISSAILTAGCGVDVKTGESSGINASSKSESWVYSLEENGCKTGSHQFNSLNEECSGLQNNSLNNNCAYSLRKMTFESAKCPGTFTTS